MVILHDLHRHVPVIYRLTLHVLPVQQEALPNHRVHLQLIRNSAYRAYNTRGRNYRPPDTFHLLRATTAQPDELTRCGMIIHPPYTTMGLQQLRLLWRVIPTCSKSCSGSLHYNDDLRYTKSYREYVAHSVQTSAYIPSIPPPIHIQTLRSHLLYTAIVAMRYSAHVSTPTRVLDTWRCTHYTLPPHCYGTYDYTSLR